MNRLKDIDTIERKTRSLTLKSNNASEDNSEESSSGCNDKENMHR